MRCYGRCYGHVRMSIYQNAILRKCDFKIFILFPCISVHGKPRGGRGLKHGVCNINMCRSEDLPLFLNFTYFKEFNMNVYIVSYLILCIRKDK